MGSYGLDNVTLAAAGGAALMVIVVAITIAARRRSRRRASLQRCWDLFAEAVAAHQRISGDIDAATYQARMKDLAAGPRK